MMVEVLIAEENTEKITEHLVDRIRKKILFELKVKHKIKDDTIERCVGMFLRDQFEKNQMFAKLKQECQAEFD